MTNRVIEVIRRAGGAASAAASAVRAEAAALSADTDALAAAASASAAAASALSVDAANLLTKTGNLAGLSSPAVARTNLGVPIEKIEKGTLSASSAFAFLVPSDMDGIEIIVSDVVPSTNNGQLSVQVGTGTLAAPTWITAANYSVSAIFQSSAAPNFINVTQNTFTLSTQIKTAGVLPNIAKMRAYGFNGSAGINVLFDAIGVVDIAGTATNQSINGGGRLQTPNNYTLCRLLPLIGTVSCNYTILGYRK